MAQTIAQFDAPVADTTGTHYRARACGREREDGLWEGWLEFESLDTGETIRTIRETTQPNLTDLNYWATGLTPVYLEGALARALQTPAPRAPVTVVPPHYDGPAERRRVKSTGAESILNPFSVYEKSPDQLAQELTALRGRHLRQIIRDYGLSSDSDEALESMSEPELGSLIMQRMRRLHL
jgi:hypothetical protein